MSARPLWLSPFKSKNNRLNSMSSPTSANGHRALIARLRKWKAAARVSSLEATGIYSLDLALALNAAEGIEVAALNPKAVVIP
jgi:hypothetical protein